ncbi:MAG: membrane protein insertase YidC, partial [Shewanellaceae bacterium]|nr:membrane protein insertase YidC [Shewanellaceae bacterium]
MIETLHMMLIEPIVWFMEFILSQAYLWVDSYGLAIVMLSISISTLLIPLQQWAQRWQLEDQILQQRMAPKKAEFKAVYQGQERFMMMKALYRQHNYHPIMSLKSSAGLLLQIPFFIAAYVFFTSLPLSGQAFGYIQDLSQPDALWQINQWSIHILPFIMAGINLLSAVIFANSMSSSEKYQLYGMSLLFLVVLYNAPSALVLYWICNNLYALVKLLWQQPKPGLDSTLWQSTKRQIEYVAGVLCVYTLLIVLGLTYLPEGFNQEFIRTALPFFVWLPAMYGLYQLYQLLTRSSLTIQRQREPIQWHELTYVWIILIPIAQYLIYNQEDFTGSQIIATIFLTTLALCVWLIGLPYLLSHLIPKKILQGALLMFTLSIAYM